MCCSASRSLFSPPAPSPCWASAKSCRRLAVISLCLARLLVIGVAYFLIARGDLPRNADLILIGTLYKLAYAGTAFYYWSQGSLPHVAFAALFGVADAVFFILMAECYCSLEKKIKG